MEQTHRDELADLAASFPSRLARSTSYVLPFGKAIIGRAEAVAVLGALRDGRLATGETIADFEAAFGAKLGYSSCVAVGSGSVANLLALETLIATGRLRRGDRVAVAGATFVTAAAPVAQVGCVPVFVDTAPGDLNVDLEGLARACERDGARAALVPHTLGQAIDLERLQDVAQRSGIALIEDCCESLAVRSGGRGVGTVGDLATFSFYAGHHVTTAEGGMIAAADPELADVARSLRAFGRDPRYRGERFRYPLGDRPVGPDERYVYVRLGFNGKMTDLQAAIGIEQLERLDEILASRRRTAALVVDVLRAAGLRLLGDPLEDGAQPFGVAFVLPDQADQARTASALEEAGVEVRSFLGASLAHQPCFDDVEKVVSEPYRNVPALARRALVVGCAPDVDLDAARAALSRALESAL